MVKFKLQTLAAMALLCAAGFSPALARNFDIPGGDLETALKAYSGQSGISLIVSADEVKGVRTKGVIGDLSVDDALSRLLSGTGFVVHKHASGKVGIARENFSDDVRPTARSVGRSTAGRRSESA